MSKSKTNNEPTNIISYLIKSPPSKETQEILRVVSGEKSKEMLCYIYRAVLGEKTFYICWAGGKFIDDCSDVEFTLAGQASLEALRLYPGIYEELVIAELKVSDLPLRLQITYILNRLPNLSRVCFFGDMSELTGKLVKAFNVCDEKGNSYSVFDEKQLDLIKKNYSLC